MRADKKLSAIEAKVVKELRELSGAGLLECKKALVNSGGDRERALAELKRSGDGPSEPEPEVSK
jgi:elongation factor Ts